MEWAPGESLDVVVAGGEGMLGSEILPDALATQATVEGLEDELRVRVRPDSGARIRWSGLAILPAR